MSSAPVIHNAADRAQVSKARDKDKQRARQWKRDVQDQMSTPTGRRFMYGVMERAGFMRLSFVAGAPDATAFNEGMRNLGLNLYVDISALCPEKFAVMMKENVPMDAEPDEPETNTQESANVQDQ